jgi:hypothetical protein
MLPMGFGDDWLRFNGLGENVAWGMYNNDTPTEAQKEQLFQIYKWGASRRMAITQHWNNNRSVHHLLDVLERVDRETPIAPLRWSIAHLNDATPENLRRMKALGVGWLMQNAMFFNGEAFLKARGSEAMRLTPPIMTALKLGIPIGGGTDAHRVMSYNPFVSLQWMVDGRTVGGHAHARRGAIADAGGGAAVLYPRQRLVHLRRRYARFAQGRQARGSRGADQGLSHRADERDRPHRVGAHHGGRADRLRRRPIREVGGKAPLAWARSQVGRRRTRRGHWLEPDIDTAARVDRRSRTARRRKPARLQPGKFAIVA